MKTSTTSCYSCSGGFIHHPLLSFITYKRYNGIVLLSIALIVIVVLGMISNANNVFASEVENPTKVKIWIYFKDKGQEVSDLKSSSQIPTIIAKRMYTLESKKNSRSVRESSSFTSPTNVAITEKALARRRKQLTQQFGTNDNVHVKRSDLSISESSLYSVHDIPIYEDYIERIESILRTDQKIGVRSNWLNAISVADVTQDQVLKIRKMDFVQHIEQVASFKQRTQVTDDPIITTKSSSRTTEQNTIYGLAQEQLSQINVIPLLESNPNLNGTGVTVLICDSGFHRQHRAFKNLKLVAEYDFVYGDTNTDNEQNESSTVGNHGTQCLSALAGYDPYTFMGVAPGVSVLLAKTEDVRSETPAEEDNFIAAIEWGERMGADILSASLGYTDWYSHSKKNYNGVTSPLTRVANIASRYKGIVMVLAAGNEGNEGISTPADAFDSITVGSVDSSGGISVFSSRGPSDDGRVKPEVCARGTKTNVVAPNSESEYTTNSGTSFSTPIVAGCVALAMQMHPDWTPYQVRKAFMLTASQASAPDNNYGWGIVNLAGVMNFSQNSSSTYFNDSPTPCPVTTNLGPLYNSECGWKANRGVCFNGLCRCYLASSTKDSCDIPSAGSSIVTKCGLHNCKGGVCSKEKCQCFYGWSGTDCSIQDAISISSTILFSLNTLVIVFLCIIFM
ncbi:hypothetical protein C9374_005672 [Naegleria lovaniensis]|uniref:Peptidase S8/S53 domain-containing protein n=1 Tax=Naegleria lovaniensis TaxID=51637 RepID=A0AA88GKI9_NAELO|nr:uncharacterized protein C9374_005672 [Naegleria lovaniensis]KAG2381880.1 hypothetical protein C9374_005672 [Naegleria lovaniensis]